MTCIDSDLPFLGTWRCVTPMLSAEAHGSGRIYQEHCLIWRFAIFRAYRRQPRIFCKSTLEKLISPKYVESRTGLTLFLELRIIPCVVNFSPSLRPQEHGGTRPQRWYWYRRCSNEPLRDFRSSMHSGRLEVEPRDFRVNCC
jgi:hypothetical protein